MAGVVFKQTLPAEEDPFDKMEREAALAEAERTRKAQALVDDLQRRRDAITGKSSLAPEQVLANQYGNDKAYKLGMAAMLSGGEGLQNMGGVMFKQALAQRTPQVTEHGIANPLTGEWSYSPEYQREKLDAQIIAARQHAADTEDKNVDRSQARREGYVFKRWMAQNKPETPDKSVVVVQNPDGTFSYINRSEAVGKTAPAPGSGQPGEGERNAAGFHTRMVESGKVLDQFEGTGTPTAGTQAIGAVPYVGDYLQRSAQTPAQQQYSQAAQDWVRAKLRKESGAAIGKDEMAQEIRAYFPQPGDGPDVIAQKRRARAVATQSMAIAAGRAQPHPSAVVPGGQPAPSAAVPSVTTDDPLGLR